MDLTPAELFVEKIASIDRGWLHAAGSEHGSTRPNVEKIASIDRGWLLGISVVKNHVGMNVEKRASIDRGWLLIDPHALKLQCQLWRK